MGRAGTCSAASMAASRLPRIHATAALAQRLHDLRSHRRAMKRWRCQEAAPERRAPKLPHGPIA